MKPYVYFLGGLLPAIFQQFIDFSTSPYWVITLLIIQVVSVIKFYRIIKNEKNDY